MKVLTSNYNAEYGARSGGQINYSIRNGTPEFHGSGAFYYRNEGLNANEWFNNRTGTKRPRYRYENVVATIGGPVLIPGTGFNKSHNKLFFFFSYDYLHNNGFTTPQRYTMPTALERAGDFSQTVTTTGALIPINDPLTGKQFPGNVIPSSRWSSTGAAMMNLFPAPNTTDPTGQRQYNFESINPMNQPRSDIIVRVDYPISPKATLYGRFLRDWQSQGPYGGILGPSGGGWRQYPHQYAIASSGYVATLIYSFRPNLTSETVYGMNIAHQMVEQLDDAMYANSLLPLKDAKGQPVPLIHFFDGNYMNLRPNVNFGFPSGFSAQSSGQGVTSAPGYGFDSRWPFDGTDRVHNVTSNLTWIKGPHQVKAGFYYERMSRNVSIYSVYNTAGTYYFGSDRAQPCRYRISVLQFAHRRHMVLRRRQPEAGQPCPILASRMVCSGHLEGAPAADVGSGHAIRLARCAPCGRSNAQHVRRQSFQCREGRPAPVPHIGERAKDGHQQIDGKDLPLRPAGGF